MKKILRVLIGTVLIMQIIVSTSKIQVIAEEQLLAKSAVLIDGENGRILYGKEPDKIMAMASTTKIMTCIVALENSTPDKVMTVSEKAAGMPKVHMNSRKGEQYYMRDLLYAMMLESYNDIAVVVAENVAGSVEEFAKLMNKKAKEIGAVNTNFVTPNGLDADKHYSTAYDMALIGAYAVKNETFVKIVTTSSYSFTDVSGKRRISVSNKDAFLTMDKDSLGIKTGFTGKAGYCFVGAVKSDDRLFVSCVLACGWPPNKSYKWHDTKILMNLGKEQYDYKTVLQGNRLLEVGIEKGTKKNIMASIDKTDKMLVSDSDEIEIKTSIDYHMPVKEGDTIGSADVYVNNDCIKRHKIIALESVSKFDYAYCLEKILDYVFLKN